MAEVTLVYRATGTHQDQELPVYLSSDCKLYLPSLRDEFKLCRIKLDGVMVPDNVEYSPATYAPNARIVVSGTPLATEAAIAAAAAAAAATQADMLQAALLQMPLDDIQYEPGPKSSGRGVDGKQFILSDWDLLADERDGITAALAELEGKTVTPVAPPSALLQALNTAESETNELFFQSACARISNIYQVNHVRLLWKLTPLNQQDNTRPDFVLEPPHGGRAIMVGEGKFPSVVEQVLLRKYVMEARAGTARRRQAPGCAVEQQCGYMESRGLRYGFLTTYRLTHFLKYMGPKRYAITKGMLCTVAPTTRPPQPSIAAILYYLCEKARVEGPIQETLLIPLSVAAPSGAPAARGPPGLAGGGDQSAGPPAKLAKIQEAGGHGALGQGDAPASAACRDSMPSLIPEDALCIGGQLGASLCGIVHYGWWYGKEVAIKSVDAHNSSHLIPHLQCEADLLSGRLQDLQGVCVPTLYASGYWRGYLMFVLATSVIHGRHPEAGQESAAVAASAEQALRDIHARGVAHNDICEDNMLIDADGKVWFIDFGASTTDPSAELYAQELQELRLVFCDWPAVISDDDDDDHWKAAMGELAFKPAFKPDEEWEADNVLAPAELPLHPALAAAEQVVAPQQPAPAKQPPHLESGVAAGCAPSTKAHQCA